MKVNHIDTITYRALTCPNSGMEISFYEPMDIDRVLEDEFILGVTSPETPDDVETTDKNLRESWRSFWDECTEKDEMMDFEEILNAFNWPNTIALEVTAPHGSTVAGTIVFLVEEDKFSNSLLILDDELT
ncbi:MAG: hypothetical protein ACQEXO_05440 [Pseudomonadota bacterium]